MGYDAYSYAVYGITVNRQNLETKQKKRGCGHKTDETKKFCSECGKPVWVEKTVSILDQLDQDEDNKLSYFTESGDCSRMPNYDFMIGFKLGSTGYNRNRFNLKEPTEQMKQEILKFIEENKLGLTEKDIKTIIFTLHSY